MSAPKASPAAIAAVQEALGCSPTQVAPQPGPQRYVCVHHWDNEAAWTDRGCSEAVAAADAAAPHNAATALRDAGLGWDDDASPLARVSSRYVRNSLMRAADRIEAGS